MRVFRNMWNTHKAKGKLTVCKRQPELYFKVNYICMLKNNSLNNFIPRPSDWECAEYFTKFSQNNLPSPVKYFNFAQYPEIVELDKVQDIDYMKMWDGHFSVQCVIVSFYLFHFHTYKRFIFYFITLW